MNANLSKTFFNKKFASAAASLTAAAVIIELGMDGAMALISSSKKPSEQIVVRMLPVAAIAATKDAAYSVSRSYSGRIVARRTSDVGFELDGLVRKILVDDGDRVPAGAVIARLDTEQLAAQREQLVARLEVAQARLALAKLNLARAADLYASKNTSKQLYDERRFQVAALKAQTKSIKAALKAIDVKIGKSLLRAPFTAIVAKRYIDEGVVLTAGQPVVRLLESGRLEARIGLPASLARRVPMGGSQVLEVNGVTYKGVVKAVIPEVDRSTRTVTVILAMPNGPEVPSGEMVQLRLVETFDSEGYWLPTTALTEGMRGLWTVFVLNSTQETEEDGIFEVTRRDVEVLHTESSRVFVRGTLQNGDLVVNAGTHRLVPGQLVKLARNPNPTVALVSDPRAGR